MKWTRGQVFQAFNSERDYQDEKWPDSLAAGLDAFALYIQGYANELTYIASHSGNPLEKLHAVRKVGALCVAAMEAHGAPHRDDTYLERGMIE